MPGRIALPEFIRPDYLENVFGINEMYRAFVLADRFTVQELRALRELHESISTSSPAEQKDGIEIHRHYELEFGWTCDAIVAEEEAASRRYEGSSNDTFQVFVVISGHVEQCIMAYALRTGPGDTYPNLAPGTIIFVPRDTAYMLYFAPGTRVLVSSHVLTRLASAAE